MHSQLSLLQVQRFWCSVVHAVKYGWGCQLDVVVSTATYHRMSDAAASCVSFVRALSQPCARPCCCPLCDASTFHAACCRMAQAVLLTGVELCVLAGDHADRQVINVDAVLTLVMLILDGLQESYVAPLGTRALRTFSPTGVENGVVLAFFVHHARC